MVGNKLRYSILLVLIIFMISSVSALSWTANATADVWTYNSSGVFYIKYNWSNDYGGHTFQFFVPNGSINYSYLLVGGGGSGGAAGSSAGGEGGGGAGQVLSGTGYNPSSSVYGTSINVIIGKGGVAQANNGRGGAGDPTTITSFGLSAAGGGAGGSDGTAATRNGTDGASGGGGGASYGYPGSASAGYPGGYGVAAATGGGGGGGGAGGYGGNGADADPKGGVGGIGVLATNDIEISGGRYYGGGGFGGNWSTIRNGGATFVSGSNGGAGSGGQTNGDGQPAQLNSGSGGGGAGYGGLTNAGGYGANGLVIISYSFGPPNTTFTSNATTPLQYAFKPIQFTLSDINGSPSTSWNWSFGDGTYSTSKNPTMYYTSNGLKTISVNSTNAYGSFIRTNNNMINITSGNITFSSNKTTPQFYLNPIQFYYVVNGTTPQTWNWTFGDGEATSTSQYPVYTFKTIGWKSISVYTTGIYGELINTTTNNYINLINLTPPVVTFSSNKILPQTTGVPVQFTLNNVGSYTLSTSWNWSFGDGNYSILRNPLYSYVDPGIYTVSVNATSGINGSYVYTQINYIKVISAPNSLYYHGMYGSIINQDLGTPLPNLTVRITNSSTGWSQTTSSLTDGSFYFRNITDGIYVIGITNYKYGEFRSSPLTVFGDDYLIGEIELVPGASANPSAQQQNWYTPHVVKFTVTDRTYGTVISGANIDINYMRNTFPAEASADWLVSAYGMNATMANDMFNSLLVMSGISDSNGGAAFTLLASSGYNIRIYNTTSGLDQTVQVYPIESEYNIWITENPTSNSDSTYVKLANTSLTYNAPNSSYGTFGLTYQDLSGDTTSVTFNVTCINNRTVMFSETIAGFGISPVYSNYTIKAIRGQQWRWSYNATRS